MFGKGNGFIAGWICSFFVAPILIVPAMILEMFGGVVGLFGFALLSLAALLLGDIGVRQSRVLQGQLPRPQAARSVSQAPGRCRCFRATCRQFTQTTNDTLPGMVAGWSDPADVNRRVYFSCHNVGLNRPLHRLLIQG